MLAGCAAQSNSQSSQSSQVKSEKKAESKASSKSAAKSAASSAVSSTKSSSSRASSKSAASSSQRADANRMGTLTSQLRVKLPGMLLPAADGLGRGSSNLNIRYTSSSSQNVVYYSVGNSPLALNDSRIASEKPYAVLTENKNVADASSLINYQEPKTGLPAVKIAGNDDWDRRRSGWVDLSAVQSGPVVLCRPGKQCPGAKAAANGAKAAGALPAIWSAGYGSEVQRAG